MSMSSTAGVATASATQAHAKVMSARNHMPLTGVLAFMSQENALHSQALQHMWD
jgi:hypothetical protein